MSEITSRLPIGSVRSEADGRRFSAIWKLLVVILGVLIPATGMLHAGPLPPDFVSQLRVKLENPSPDRVRASLDLIEKMTSSGELSRALLLPEWQGQYLDGDNLEIFNAALDKFVITSQKGLSSQSPLVRKQTARIIAETGSVNSGSSSIGGAERSVARDPAFRKAFHKFQDQLF